LDGEERQRLADFASQYDASLAKPDQAVDFNFWRGYLRDMLRLCAKHPGYLRGLDTPRAAEIDSALAFLNGLRVISSASGAATRLAQGLLDTPFLANFLPAVDDAPLLAFFSSGASLPQGATLAGTTAFVEMLRKLTPLANDALAAGRADPSAGAARLAASLGKLGLEDKQQLDQFLGIMSDADHQTTRRIVARLDDGLLRKLMAAVPARMRSLLEPARLADALDIADSAPAPALVEGLRALVRDTAGNHLIDEPFLDHTYGVLSRRGVGDAGGTLAVLRGSALPMQRYVRTRPQDVARILASDVESASTLVAASDPTTYPPALFVHDLVYAAPALAASIVGVLDRRGMSVLVLGSLANLAYDADRLAADAGAPLSLAKDGAFLAALLRVRGQDWLNVQLAPTVAAYRAHVERGEVAQDFLEAFRRTLDGAIATVSDQPTASALSRAVASAFR
ncbi:MAG: hypothetical protein Q8O40_15250, partial [Chloroflexota bacterium]|nr:hypothetical protein [Chloroflexota bacterium]